MYVPKLFRLEIAEALTVMKVYPFANLITVLNNRPIVTHVPVEIRENQGKIYISGHLAYGNEQKHTLNGNPDVLLVFQGPHSYISSSWYQAENVPTWDYVAVHAYGNARVLSEDELESALATLLEHYEAHRENGRQIDTFTPGYIRNQMKGIVGFEVEITSVEASGKLSQNRNDTDYKSIVRELETSSAEDERKIAEWMRDGRSHLF